MVVARFWLAEGIFRISKQGFEVTTATEEQLLFSEARGGLVPAAKGSFSGSATFALPEAGKVPIIYFVFNHQGTYLATINAAKTTFTVSGSSAAGVSGRYVVFRNRQF